MRKTVDILRAARSRVESGWTQNYNARNAAGEGVGSGARDACKWCASGALLAESDALLLAYYEAADALAAAIDYPSTIFKWNDAPGRTKEEVLAAFDAAIQLAAAATSRDAAGIRHD